MPSEVVPKENEIGVEAKEMEKFDTKVNGSQETKTEGEVHVKDKSEESKIPEELSERDSKEIEKFETKENGSQETKTDGEVLVKDESEESKVSKKLSERDAKEIEKSETTENGSQETKIDEVLVKDKSEECNVAEDLSENDNKENEEPSVKDTELQKKRAEELLVEGKRHIIIKDFQVATDVLSEACSLFGSIYGELAEECAEAYFQYGCALLELSKDEISPVGLEEKDDEENEEVSIQEENIPETGKATLSDNTDEVEEKLSVKDDEFPEEKMEGDEEKINEVEENSNEKEKLPDEVSADDDEEKPDEDEVAAENVNDLQLAWEILELAKVIYNNKDTEESKLKLAEVLMKCGEVSIEDEQFERAIEDMTESLAIRRLLLPEDSRIIAETLFQLGIAQELGGSGERAVELLTEAAVVLNQRIKTLENSTKDDDIIKEVAEIKAIIPEIQDKIVDIKERKEAAVSALLAAVCANNAATTNGEAGSSAAKQASNINHLVRKRPKQGETDGTPNKVPKLEEESTVGQK